MAIIAEHMQKWVGEKSNAEVLAALAQAGIPAGELLSPAQVLENEHVVAGDFFQQLTIDDADSAVPIAKHPLDYSKTPIPPFEAAPKLGQHTDEILAELGFDQPQIVALRGARVI